MSIVGAPYLGNATLRGPPVLTTSAARLRALLARMQSCDGRDEDLSHDIWWELVDVPTGAARETGGRREINYTAGDVAFKPLWRPLGINHFGDDPDGPLLIESLDRVANLAERVLIGWRWQLYNGGGPDNDKCFACIYSRFGAFSAVLNSLAGAFVAAILEAKIALATADDPARLYWRQPLDSLPQGRPFDAFDASAPASVHPRIVMGR